MVDLNSKEHCNVGYIQLTESYLKHILLNIRMYSSVNYSIPEELIKISTLLHTELKEGNVSLEETKYCWSKSYEWGFL